MSSASWASAPARSTLPRCFLPETVFERSDGTHVRAAELRRCGDVLRGPGRTEVQVIDSEKHSPSERDIVCLTTRESSFHIVADHRILIKGVSGEPVPTEVCSLLSHFDHEGPPPELFDGVTFRAITKVRLLKRTVQVVDVCFNDAQAAVLAWTFPPCKVRTVRDEAAVACLGRQCADRSVSMGVRTKCTFLDVPNTPCGTRRCRSQGAPMNPLSSWSVGTQRHHHNEPELCTVCQAHHRYTSEPKRAAPCRHGAACRFCHASHPELGSRIRPAARSRRASRAGQ